VDEIRLPGRHNVLNVLAASCLAGAAGAPLPVLRHVATTFQGVAHRLELVCEKRGIHWYNDSIATSPERAIAALQALVGPLILLAGGRDKHLPWQDWADLVLDKVQHVVLFGEAAGLIHRALEDAEARHTRRPTVHHGGTLGAAVEIAARVAQPGDVVLLSPGGTSFDAYRDYTERGEHFRSLVEAL
jgi:UDP-N-acetylmuramoylalanine--D-glutamate ligase